jgi:hypothetical protein
MTAAGFRELALRLPEATEGTHHGVVDFRVGGKIYATLAYENQGCGVLLLTPAQQEGMLILASILRAFRLRYPDISKPEPVSRLTLRPKTAVKLWFETRA